MEFNRLLSQAISFYGESSSKKVISGEEKPRQKTINLKNMKP